MRNGNHETSDNVSWSWECSVSPAWWGLVKVVSRCLRISFDVQLGGWNVAGYWDGNAAYGGGTVEVVGSRPGGGGGAIYLRDDAYGGSGTLRVVLGRWYGGVAKGQEGSEETVIVD